MDKRKASRAITSVPRKARGKDARKTTKGKAQEKGKKPSRRGRDAGKTTKGEAQGKGKKPSRRIQPPPTGPALILRVPFAALQFIQLGTANVLVGRTAAAESNGHVRVLHGALADFQELSVNASWLQVVAHDLFDPIDQRGHLWVPADGTADDWEGRALDPQLWRPVEPDEPLQACVYEYVMPDNISVALPRFSPRSVSSKTSANNEDHSKRFRRQLEARDKVCVITKHRFYLIASHIVPKRLRAYIRYIWDRYVRVPGPKAIDVWDTRIGVLLTWMADTPFDNFQLGLFRDPVRNGSHALQDACSCVRYRARTHHTSRIRSTLHSLRPNLFNNKGLKWCIRTARLTGRCPHISR
jgi:hypothetical protein